MFLLIKGARIYCPRDQGIQDLLVCSGKIVSIGNLPESLDIPGNLTVIDGTGLSLAPGFVDQHVHISGGGGEAGPTTRTPEIFLSQLTTAGITTVVGLLGFDGTTRSLAGLLAKTRSLEDEGISAYMFSGAYELPVPTLTGAVKKDLVLIDKVIGIGEIAISDHRSAQPSVEMLAHLGAEARVGGMLGNKPGIVHIHIGEGKQGLSLLFDVIRNFDLPVTQFIPTHVNRLDRLFYQAIDYARQGGYIDLTAGIRPSETDPALDVPRAIERLLTSGVLLEQVTVSSDGNGSLPTFHQNGEFASMTVGSVHVLWNDIRQTVLQNILPLDKALSLITSNPATLLKIPHKGTIAVGNDADLVLLDRALMIDTVIAKGKVMVQSRQPIVRGTFELNNL